MVNNELTFGKSLPFKDRIETYKKLDENFVEREIFELATICDPNDDNYDAEKHAAVINNINAEFTSLTEKDIEARYIRPFSNAAKAVLPGAVFARSVPIVGSQIGAQTVYFNMSTPNINYIANLCYNLWGEGNLDIGGNGSEIIIKHFLYDFARYLIAFNINYASNKKEDVEKFEALANYFFDSIEEKKFETLTENDLLESLRV